MHNVTPKVSTFAVAARPQPGQHLQDKYSFKMSTMTDNVNSIQEKIDKTTVNGTGTGKDTDVTNSTLVVPSWLDNKFLEAILRRDANNEELTVVDIDVKSAVPKGDNYASLLFRVGVNYRDRQGDKDLQNRSLIVKCVPDGEIMQKFIHEMEIFAHEEHMYKVTLPAIDKLLKERTGNENGNLATKIYYTDRLETIVLEDLRPLGYKMANRREGLDLKHSIIALRKLAKLHGLSVALYAEDPTCMDAYVEKMYTEESRKMQTDMMTSILKNLSNEVKSWAGFERFEEKLINVTDVTVDRMIDLVKTKPGGVRVLNHGDFWVNNMLFRYDEEGGVQDVKMLDFQMVRFASPALDLIYFMNTSTSPQVWENHMDDLLGEYHKALCETMRLIGCEEHQFITMEQLQKEMKDKAFFAVVVSCLFCIMLAEPEDAPDFSSITEEDMENGQIDTMNKAFAGRRFRTAFQKRLPKFEMEGLL